MEVQFSSVDGLPIAIVDKLFTETECQSILTELAFLNSNSGKLHSPEQTGSAYDLDENGNIKKLLKQNKGIFLDDVYTNRNYSDILKVNRSIFNPNLIAQLLDHHLIFKYLEKSNFDRTLIQYYEQSDYYDFHFDMASITAITWFYNKPKRFVGGDMIFKNGLTIECGYNRTLIFPSVIEHCVTEVKLEKDSAIEKQGRYSMTQFFTVTNLQ